jgi:hypothetical protein
MRLLLALLATSLLLASPAAAAAVHVDVQNDENDGVCAPGDCSLREAVTFAPAGSTIDVPAGHYSLDDQITVPRSETIDGAGLAATKIDPNLNNRAFRVAAGPVTFRDLLITRGNGTPSGGGIQDTSGSLLTVDRVRLTKNNAGAIGGAPGGGGGISATGPVLVRNSLIDDNDALRDAGGAVAGVGGGGIYVNGGRLAVVDSEVRDNSTGIAGGAMNSAAALTDNGGGGIYVTGATASLTLTRSTVAGNDIGVDGTTHLHENGGGGIYLHQGSLTAVNSTLSDNQVSVPPNLVDNGGGGLFVADGQASLVNVSIAGNNASSSTAMDAGGALYRDGGSVTARNTLIASNTADLARNCFGTITSQGHNIEDANTCGLSGPGDKKSTPVTLGPLAFNGGPTRTRAIFSTGPAFDAGAACPAVDQRGVKRPKGLRCDVGAFEIAVPDAVTGGATKVTTGRAHLNGTVVPNGRPTTWSFHYGKTAAYGSSTPARSAGAGTVGGSVRATVKGLKPATRYHYRLFAASSLGVGRGRDRKFITQMRLPAKCVKNGKLTVRLQRPAGSRVVSARAFAGKKRVARKAGQNVKRLKLRALPRKGFRLRVVAKLASGESVTGSRRYRACA